MSLEKNDKLVWVDINELKPHPKNTNKHPKKQIERLAKIINYQGFRSPIVVSNLSGFIVAGHGRLEAAKLNGLTKVPVSYQDFEDAKMELAHLNADNAIALWAEIDMKAVTESLKEINFDLDLDFLGFKDFKLDSESKSGETDDDAVPEVSENEFGVKLGDIYQLGEHRIMCGDSTDQETVAKLMDGKKADMVFTDPPYNIDYQGVAKNHGKIKNDKMPDEDFVKFLEASIGIAEVIYVCCSWQYSHLFRQAMKNIGKDPKAMIVWNKVNPAQHLDKYFKQHELIFYFGPYGGNKTLRGDVWEIKRERNTVHPTMKPVELIETAIKDHELKMVYDGFLGSGSTLIACEKTNRVCYGMELDPHYVSVIIKRWQDYTGKQAVKL